MNDLLSELSALGISITPEFNTKKIIRDGSQWFIGDTFTHNGREFKIARFGDWKTSTKKTWKSWTNGAADDPAVQKQVEERLRRQNEERRRAKHEYQETQSLKLSREWREFRNHGLSSYLKKKGVQGPGDGNLWGARLDNAGNLIVPMQDIEGRFWNYQRITDNDKRFQFGARIKGCFHVVKGSVQESVNGGPIYICEGFATACSAAMALSLENCTIVSAFNAGNLKDVAGAIRSKMPFVPITILADNDAFTEVNGVPKNTGLDSALAAVEAIRKVGVPTMVVYPKFKEPAPYLTDFNDLHIVEGLEAVRSRILKDRPETVQIEQKTPQNEGKGEQIEPNSVKIDQNPPPENDGKPKKGRKPAPKYEAYRDFFDDLLETARRDIVSGRLLEPDGHVWQTALSRLGSIRSHAMDRGLPDSKVKDHLERYQSERKKELLIDLPKWDGRDRVQELLNFIEFKGGAEAKAVFEDAFKEWGANIFRRLYHNNAQNRCIILKGDQGIGKDSLVRNMLGFFGPYYAKFTNSKDERELWDQVTGKLVVHIEEFDQTGSLNVSFLKDLITRDWATYRSAYAHDSAMRKCVGSFISSVNIDTPLRDETGNRRFAVFEILKIDWEYPKECGPQLAAQFKALYDADYRAKKATWDAVILGNSKFEAVDMVPELLQLWDTSLSRICLGQGDALGNGLKELYFSHVAGVVIELCRVSGWKQQKVLSMLKANGRSRHTKDGSRYWSNMVKFGPVSSPEMMRSSSAITN